ncbi:MAG: hypothetical protein HY675_04615 [Chloroflexi bacterium]|nr:hypothetical protein [Chloroflexota bacterium]
MRVLLVFMFVALGLGLFSERLGRKELAILFGSAVAVTAIYYAFPRTI